VCWRADQKRVATETFAADDGFQKEGVLAELLCLCELEVKSERCFEICEGFGEQGNAVIALRG